MLRHKDCIFYRVYDTGAPKHLTTVSTFPMKTKVTRTEMTLEMLVIVMRMVMAYWKSVSTLTLMATESRSTHAQSQSVFNLFHSTGEIQI